MVLNIEDIRGIYFDTKQKLKDYCVLLVHVEVEKIKIMALNTHRFS